MKTQHLLTALICSLWLAGCGGGGSDSDDFSPGPYVTDPSDDDGTGADKVNIGAAGDSLVSAVPEDGTTLTSHGADEFPLYQNAARIEGDPDQVKASITTSADGSVHALNTSIDGEDATVNFAASDATQPNVDTLQAQKTYNGQRYTLTLQGIDTLDYARYGMWERTEGTEFSSKGDVMGAAYGGLETLTSNMPVDTAFTYQGSMMGQEVDKSGHWSAIKGDLQLKATFGTSPGAGTVTGEIKNITRNGAPTNDRAALDAGDISGNHFKGDLTLYDKSTPTGDGHYDGRFFGPNADEVAGKWRYSKNDGGQGLGAFGGKR